MSTTLSVRAPRVVPARFPALFSPPPPPQAVQQQDDARTEQQAEEKIENKSAAKERLVQAITQAKVGSGVTLVAVPHN